ncbi:MAG: MBL fold metallo-hydrolase [Chloroflexi bacterium]|nr:MBL fold metallo-hydrolase [Chloroflexota bacterium]MBM3174379.1 MBL fold metallo-hydrolase [Chloroflexota bacterium]
MWIREPGKVTDRLDFLGTTDNCLYLLKGKAAMIIGGGMSWVAPSLEKQFSQLDFAPEKLKYLVLSHSHFDHCGAAPYLKRKFPHIQILASAYSEKVFSKEKAVNFIAATNKYMIDRMGLQQEYERLNLKFDGIHVDHIVTENDIIDVGDGIKVHFIEVPGHTQCSIAVHIPELKALFPSDAAPPPTGTDGVFFPGPQYDFGMYKQSLERLASYEVEICAFEHYGVVIGDEATKILQDGLRQTEWFKNLIIALYQQTGDFDQTVKRAAAETMQKSEFDFMDKDTQLTILTTVIRKILSYAKLLDEPQAT